MGGWNTVGMRRSFEIVIKKLKGPIGPLNSGFFGFGFLTAYLFGFGLPDDP